MPDNVGEPEGFMEGDEFDPDVVSHVEQQAKEALTDETKEISSFLEGRRLAYVEVFSKGSTSQKALDTVILDLAAFCRTYSSKYSMMDGEHADTLMRMKEGRREVFQRITDHMRLGQDRLFIKYTDATNKT